MFKLLRLPLLIIVISTVVYAFKTRGVIVVPNLLQFIGGTFLLVGAVMLIGLFSFSVNMAKLQIEIRIMLGKKDWMSVLELMEAIGEKRLAESPKMQKSKLMDEPDLLLHSCCPSIGLIHNVLYVMGQRKEVVNRWRVLDEARLLARGGRGELEFKLTGAAPRRRFVFSKRKAPEWGGVSQPV